MAAGTSQTFHRIRYNSNNFASINLHGATIQSWVHNGSEMLFVSKNSVFDNKKAIRGGMPIVFPCFGPWELGPQHGFARISAWSLCQNNTEDEDGNVFCSFELTDNDYTRSLWNNKFKLIYTVIVKPNGLSTQLSVHNLNDKDSFSFTWLLHTYFSLPDITRVTVSGLKGLTYIDKVDGLKEKEENNEYVKITSFTDRVYKGASESHIVTNVSEGKDVCIKKNNFPDTVVWNPWEEKAKAMADFGDDEYQYMICVEAGRVSTDCTLSPGNVYTSSQTIDVLDVNKL